MQQSKKIQKILLCSLLLFGCKNTEVDSPNLKYDENISHVVSFNLKTTIPDFNVVNSNSYNKILASTEEPTDIKKSMNYIYYIPFKYKNSGDPEGSYRKPPIKVIRIDKTNENFGTIKDELDEGLYDIVFIATKDSIEFNKTLNDSSLPKDFYVNKNPLGTDLFYKRITLSVDGELTTTESISLERIVSSVQIKLDDPIPSNIKSLSIHWADAYYFTSLGGKLFNKDTAINTNYIKVLSESDNGKDNYFIDLYYIKAPGGRDEQADESNLLDLEISALGSDNLPKYKKTIKDIPFLVGKRTLLQGSLFTDPNMTDGITVTLPDTSWIVNKEVIF